MVVGCGRKRDCVGCVRRRRRRRRWLMVAGRGILRVMRCICCAGRDTVVSYLAADGVQARAAVWASAVYASSHLFVYCYSPRCWRVEGHASIVSVPHSSCGDARPPSTRGPHDLDVQRLQARLSAASSKLLPLPPFPFSFPPAPFTRLRPLRTPPTPFPAHSPRSHPSHSPGLNLDIPLNLSPILANTNGIPARPTARNASKAMDHVD